MFVKDQLGFIAMFSAATHYFSSEGDANPPGSARVYDGFKLGSFTHLGSIAFGSMLQTLIYLIRKAIESMEDDQPVVACCTSCLMSCIEGAIECLTRLAIANMAISGDTFCKSAWTGFLLNLKHMAKFIFA